MLGAVHSCDVINYASSGSYKVKCISIVPYAESMTGFSRFIGSKYSCEEMIAPWEYGSTLTFSTRNEGLTSSRALQFALHYATRLCLLYSRDKQPCRRSFYSCVYSF